jgi:Tfp pilus assembly protein PilN
VKAVNLIPADSRKGGTAPASPVQYASYALFGVLAVALVLVVLYVLASNDVSARRAQLSTLKGQVSQAQAEVTRLGSYQQFQQLAHTRIQTVEGIAATRFDWHAALADLSRVVPANTSLQSLTATVAPGASVGGSSGGGSSLRADIPAPAFELAGCTRTQDDVARLISRLRLIDGVQRVTLGQSAKTESSSAATGVSSSSGTSVGCGAGKPNFDVVVFFQPLAGAGPQGATTLGTSATSGGSK